MNYNLLTVFLTLCLSVTGWAQSIVTNKSSFAITSAVIYVDSGEPELVKTASTLLQQDSKQVTGKKLSMITDINQMYDAVTDRRANLQLIRTSHLR